jgi:hypothetical protein
MCLNIAEILNGDYAECCYTVSSLGECCYAEPRYAEYPYAECHYSKYRYCFVMLSLVMWSVVLLSIVKLSFVTLIVIILSAFTMNVVAPIQSCLLRLSLTLIIHRKPSYFIFYNFILIKIQIIFFIKFIIMSILLVNKVFKGTNTLAYLSRVSATKKKSYGQRW